jgi:hypothetical protein
MPTCLGEIVSFNEKRRFPNNQYPRKHRRGYCSSNGYGDKSYYNHTTDQNETLRDIRYHSNIPGHPSKINYIFFGKKFCGKVIPGKPTFSDVIKKV